MAHEMRQPQEFDEFERALAALRPRGSQANRERLMYQAGQASVVGTTAGGPIAVGVGGPAGWAWPAMTAVMTLATVVLSVVVFMRPEPEIVRQTVYVDRPVPQRAFSSGVMPRATSDSEQVLTSHYLITRRAVLLLGIDALPSRVRVGDVARTAPATVWELMNEMREGEPGAGRTLSDRDGLFY